MKICLACNREFSDTPDTCPVDGTPLIGLKVESGSELTSPLERPEHLYTGRHSKIFKVWHAGLEKDVIAKVATDWRQPNCMKSLENESNTLRRLDHPFVVKQIGSCMTKDGAPCQILEFVPGKSLRQILHAKERLSLREACEIFVRVCDALSYLHEQNLIHPVLVPQHILVDTSSSRVVLIDFRQDYYVHDNKTLAIGDEAVQYACYASPEQLMNKDTSWRSNIYALGCIMYEALSGQVPFKGNNTLQTASKQLSENQKPLESLVPNLPKTMQTIINTSLQKDQFARKLSAADIKTALQDILSEMKV